MRLNRYWIALHVIIVVMLAFAGNLLLAGCAAQSSTPKFDAEYAWSMLVKQCDFGPRYPGSKAHVKTRDFLASELRKYTDAVTFQEFSHVLGGEDTKMWNIIARFGDAEKRGILLCAHWDTRPIADMELDPEKRTKPIIGANDGASGVAVHLELARMFHEHPPPVPVTIVLFDGEDYGPELDNMLLGSRHFATRLDEYRNLKYGILLDMIGDKELEIYREGNSERGAKFVADTIWEAAKSLGYDDTFRDQVKYTITDDHVPLIEAGLPCALIIDFDYAYWHTLQDTVDKCSPESLRIVGETVAKVVYSATPESLRP